MDLSAEKRRRLEELAKAMDFGHPHCGHVHVGFTVTRVADGVPTIICEHCFLAVRDEDRAGRLAQTPLDPSLACGLCGAAPARQNVDLGMGVCDGCLTENERLGGVADRAHLLKPRAAVAPDEVSPDMLFIGPKEAAYELEVLLARGIMQVLVCCDSLPAPLHGHAATAPTGPAEPAHRSSRILFHRLPLADSLAQGLALYLPSALAFIAQGVLRGTRTLVHCNAGVSRSGAVAVEWLRRMDGLTFDAALVAARRVRPIITPNSNFVSQLRALPDDDEAGR